jgi:hypothetical protein
MAYAAFDWSALDRTKLYDVLNSVRKHVVGRKLLIEDLHKILANQIRKNLPVKVKLVRTAEQEHGIIYIGGCYYGDEDEEFNNRYVEIVLSYFVWDEYLTITQHRWRRMCEVFADTVLHEIIHIRQYRTREWKNIPGYYSSAELANQRKSQNYYGHPDEIGAYAFNIACELYDRFGNNSNLSIKYLNSNQAVRHKTSTYLRYLKTFDMDHQHSVIKRLKKKVIYYLPYAKIGKPFKTSNYLTY